MAATAMSLFIRDDRLASQLTDDQRKTGCVKWDPTVDNSYHYQPHLSAGLVFSIVFGLSTLVHLAQTTIKRKWWYLTFALGAIGELMGWAARTDSHYCPYKDLDFMLQIAVLIISPCFFSAGLYYMLSVMITQKWGRDISPISPRFYVAIFVTFDLVSIAIQGAGGGIAASGTTDSETANGAHIMLAGIAIQLASMAVFVFLWFLVISRANSRGYLRAEPRLKLPLLVWTAGAVLIVTRNIYRCVELAQGWNGYLISREVYFAVLDGMLMAICVVLFNIVHPAWYLNSASPATTEDRNLESSDEEKPVKKSRFAFGRR
ncbi:MAG: hypothetical protein Q9227_000949 [Pyrenula ochraceoflavens]